jgi:hypothetical protein
MNSESEEQTNQGAIFHEQGAYLARMARVSPLTIDRIEKGMPCRLETKRKIIQGL